MTWVYINIVIVGILSTHIEVKLLFKMQRINWIDWAKSIAIIMVVFGHIPENTNNFLIRYICTFHMPLFFFISGYLSKRQTNLSNNIKKYWHSLIIPYFIYHLLPILVGSLHFRPRGGFVYFQHTCKTYSRCFSWADRDLLLLYCIWSHLVFDSTLHNESSSWFLQ